MSGRFEMYSTVGDRVPICRLSRILYMLQISLRACEVSLKRAYVSRHHAVPTSNSNLAMCTTIRLRRSWLYTSFATCAMTSVDGSASFSPARYAFVDASNLEISSFVCVSV